MKCSNCGSELNEGEKFCGKCGKPINIDERKPIKLSFKKCITIILGIIIIIILIAYGYDKINDNSKKSSTNTSNTTAIEKKEYYDFIDTDYYTFNFTESQFINRVMDGNSYISKGYERKTATIDNTYNYTKVSLGGIENIQVTINPSNNKVSKITVGIIGTYSQSEFETMVTTLFENTLVWILNTDTDNETEVEEAKTIGNEIIDGTAGDKGLTCSGSIDDSSCSVTFQAVE